MTVKHLGHTDFEVLMKCFLKAFENYFVQMPTDHDFYRQRWKAAKVDFELSFGMFDGDTLVGFIINAIDERDGTKVAFNAGTGVLPSYRGQRIVKQIYNSAIPILKANGVKKCALEVITDNTIAIRSYESIGFVKEKHFLCFSGQLKLSQEALNISQVAYSDINWDEMPHQDLYAWDSHYAVLKESDYSYYQIRKGSSVESYIVIDHKSGYIAQCGVLEETNAAYQRLGSAIAKLSESVRINNVDERLETKIKAFKSFGLTNSINQFEMALHID